VINNPVIFYDSGAGGLTVMKAAERLNKNENYIYYSDRKNMPYGNKSYENLKALSEKNIKFLMKLYPKIIVLACNTLSTNYGEELKNNFSVPIITVTPYENFSPTEKVLLLCTPLTGKSGFVEKMKRNNANLTVYTPKNLAFNIEHNILKPESVDISELYPLSYKNFDRVILGCTHYILIKKRISALFENSIVSDTNLITALKIKEFTATVDHPNDKGQILFLNDDYSLYKYIYDRFTD